MIYRIHEETPYNIAKLGGYLDFNSLKAFITQIKDLYNENPQTKIIINMKHLEFVGSSGITLFVKELLPFNEQKFRPLYCHMKNEYIRIFRMFEQKEAFLIFNTFEDAKSYGTQMYRDSVLSSSEAENVPS